MRHAGKGCEEVAKLILKPRSLGRFHISASLFRRKTFAAFELLEGMVDFRVDHGSVFLQPLVLSTKNFKRALYHLVRIFAGSGRNRPAISCS